MLSRQFQGAGDDAAYSAAAISCRGIRRWFVFLVLFVVPISLWAQVNCVPGASPSVVGPQSSGAVSNERCGVPIKPAQGIHIDVDLALVNVAVSVHYGRSVTGLESSNFRVFDNNIEQEVVTFSSEESPISVGVIFDKSGSMTDKIGRAREAVIQFFKTCNPQDEFFFVSFNESAELTSTLTNSIEDLQKRLVREADTQLYAIGIFDPLEYRSRTPEELNGPSLLSEITEMTGGRVFAVENLNELLDTAEKIAMELR